MAVSGTLGPRPQRASGLEHGRARFARETGGRHGAAHRAAHLSRVVRAAEAGACFDCSAHEYRRGQPALLNSGYAAAMLPTFVLAGVGFGLACGPLNGAATNGIAPEQRGFAGGLVNTSLQLGVALVLAVVTAVNSANTGGSPVGDELFRAAARRGALAISPAATCAARSGCSRRSDPTSPRRRDARCQTRRVPGDDFPRPLDRVRRSGAEKATSSTLLTSVTATFRSEQRT